MAYIYKIGYYSHEDSHYNMFQHDNEYSEVELQQIISDTIVSISVQSYEYICKNYNEVIEAYKNECKDSELYIPEMFGHPSISGDRLITSEEFITALTKQGFTLIKPAVSVGIWGWNASDSLWEEYTPDWQKDMWTQINNKIQKENK